MPAGGYRNGHAGMQNLLTMILPFYWSFGPEHVRFVETKQIHDKYNFRVSNNDLPRSAVPHQAVNHDT